MKLLHRLMQNIRWKPVLKVYDIYKCALVWGMVLKLLDLATS